MWRVLVLSAAIVGGAWAAHAETPAALAEKTASLIAAEKPAEALGAAEALRDAAWQAAPLGFTTARFVAAPAKGYGRYEPREDTTFKAGEPIAVYAEPVGYGFGRDGEDILIDLDADLELRTPDGQILVAQTDFTRLSARTRRPVYEFQVSFSLNLSGLQPGDYVLFTRLKDAHSDKAGSFELPFTIKGPEPAPKPQ
ncbi:hypothetical protein [Rhodobium gokarnense]|uniref:Uncharacterized protein n=1 Tax=Rhodobium gokarnense TaxID=364296 RepID=A0ABT3HCS8_9HYPH|nr:hypothetical protein [Rhodobium gokarnense]MCW2308149.1 hypothetical protein [Rhodobium gokarnense]